MWLFKKSPQELLEEKYLELIERNWVDNIELNPHWCSSWYGTCYSGIIRWVEWVWIFVYREDYYETNYSYWWKVWKVESEYLAEKVFKIIDKIYKEEQDNIRKEEERKAQEAKEEEQRAKDREFIEEYSRLSWVTGEFSKQFKLLDEIEYLWKKQVKLLEEWEENKNLIYKKREQFYSLTQ